MTTLHTKYVPEGIELTFPSGKPAGTICYVGDSLCFRHMDPDGQWTGPRRACTRAAEYDALAWATDRIARGEDH